MSDPLGTSLGALKGGITLTVIIQGLESNVEVRQEAGLLLWAKCAFEERATASEVAVQPQPLAS